MSLLEIIVCHSNHSGIRTSVHFIDDVMEDLQVLPTEYHVTVQPEDTLDMPTTFPSNAIVYVHGNFYNEYENVGKARQLAAQRQDLKLIINVDGSKLREEHFQDQADREYIRALLEQGFDPQQQVVVSTSVAPEFFSSRNRSEQSFKYYLQQLRRP